MHAEGVYACEDTHTSFIAHFGGAAGRPDTFLELAKSRVDRLHTLEPGGAPTDPFTLSTDAIHFYDRMVVFERRPRTPPTDRVYGREARLRYVAPSVSGRA